MSFQSKTKTIASSAKSYKDNTQFKVQTATKLGNPDQKVQLMKEIYTIECMILVVKSSNVIKYCH